jgi:hypothetical protein
MQALLMSEIKQRKPRPKRDATAITYRLIPAVKQAVAESAVRYGRSDNQQAEFLLKVGYLHTLGTKISEMSDAEILNKFDEVSKSLIDEEGLNQ